MSLLSVRVQGRPVDYAERYLTSQLPVTFHRHWNIDPIAVYQHWLTDSDTPTEHQEL